MGPSTSARRSPYAKYTCSACRTRKVRCKLPESFQLSNTAPLSTNEACERCQRLGISCVVQQRYGSFMLARDGASMEDSPINTPARPDTDAVASFRSVLKIDPKSSAIAMSYRRRPGVFLAKLLQRTATQDDLHIVGKERYSLNIDMSRLEEYESK
jgi:hypothetical protein